MKNRKGFTLIELMIVIAIIGILAAMAIPNFKKARASARQKACYSNIRVLQGAIEMYNMDVSTMITTMSDQVQNQLISGKYIKATAPLICPETSKNGSYSASGDLTDNGEIICSWHGGLIAAGSYDNPANQ